MTFSIVRRLSAALLLTLTLSACGDDGGTPQCLAYPVCGSDQTEVDSCEEDDETCDEVTLCGATIYCQDIPTDCAAVPQCEPGDSEVDTCPEGGECYGVTECGATILCQQPESCDETPVCNEDADVQVDACPQGATCYDVTECGTTIICQQPANCDAVPACDEGDTEVDSCPQDASCYERESCGQSITCEEVDVCGESPPQPVCDEGDTRVDTCPEGATCYERESCGQSITCEEAAACPVSFECPADHQELPPCAEWSDCLRFYSCGDFRLLCTGEARTTGCRATPICPENYVMTEDDCTELDGACVEVTRCNTTIGCIPETVGG